MRNATESSERPEADEVLIELRGKLVQHQQGMATAISGLQREISDLRTHTVEQQEATMRELAQLRVLIERRVPAKDARGVNSSNSAVRVNELVGSRNGRM